MAKESFLGIIGTVIVVGIALLIIGIVGWVEVGR